MEMMKLNRGYLRKGYATLKGAEGVFDLGKVEMEFSIVSDRGECQLPDAFTGSKNIVPSRSYRVLKS